MPAILDGTSNLAVHDIQFDASVSHTVCMHIGSLLHSIFLAFINMVTCTAYFFSFLSNIPLFEYRKVSLFSKWWLFPLFLILLIPFLYSFFFFFFFFGPYLWHTEVLRPGVELVLQLRPPAQPEQPWTSAISVTCATACGNAGSLPEQDQELPLNPRGGIRFLTR